MAEEDFRRGAIGQILLFVSALILSLSYLLGGALGFSDVILLSIVSFVFLMSFGVVFLMATDGLTRRFRSSSVGKVASAFGLATSMVGFIAYMAWLLYPIFLIGFISVSMDAFAMGGVSILTGAFFMKYRRYISNKGSWGLTGIIFFVVGIALFISLLRLYLPVFLSSLAVGSLLLIVAVMGIFGAISFMNARPIGHAVEEESTAV
ncbi:MAG: hypothetical protein ACFE7E_03510 [Candidatus Hodarchaeota archaeon]